MRRTSPYALIVHTMVNALCASGLVFLAALSLTQTASAATAAMDLGAAICNAKSQFGPYVMFLGALAYVVAAFLTVSFVNLSVKHFDNPRESQTTKICALVITAGALAAFPSAVGALQTTIFATAGSSGPIVCGGSASPAANGSVGLDGIINNFVGSIYSPMFALISVIAISCGIFLIFRGLLKASKIGSDPRAAAPHAILVNLFIGAILVSVGQSLGMMLESLFGTPDLSSASSFAIQWQNISSNINDTAAIDKVIRSCLAFVQIIGAIGFVRGWLILKVAIEGSGQATVPQGLTYIIGGTFALNIPMALKIFNSTSGMSLL